MMCPEEGRRLMPRNIQVVVPNRPGIGREMFKAIADAGINIDGVCVDLRPGERWVHVHMLVEDAATTRRAIESMKLEVAADREVEVLEIEDKPGAVYEILERLAADGQNVEVLYMATGTRLVIGTEDMHEPRVGVRMENARFP
jgi:hypothetical protein